MRTKPLELTEESEYRWSKLARLLAMVTVLAVDGLWACAADAQNVMGIGQSDAPAKAQALRENGPHVMLVLVKGWTVPEAPGAPGAKPLALDRAQQMGTWFTQAYAPSSDESATLTALLTGVLPWESGITSNKQDWRKAAALRDHVSLPELFRNGGFYTAGFGAVFPYQLVNDFGKPSLRALDLSRAWDERQDVGDLDEKTIKSVEQFLAGKRMMPFFLAVGLNAGPKLNAGVSRLVDGVKRRGFLKDTVIVVAGIPANDDPAKSVRVPLWVYTPAMGATPGKVCQTPVGLAEVFPTLLEVVGELPSSVGVKAQSFAASLNDPLAVREVPVVAADGGEVTVVKNQWRYHRDATGVETLVELKPEALPTSVPVKSKSKGKKVEVVATEVPAEVIPPSEPAGLKEELAALAPKPQDWVVYTRAMEKVEFDASADGAAVYWLNAGDEFAPDLVPDVTGRGLDIEVVFQYSAATDANSTLISGGDQKLGFAVHLQEGKPAITINYDGLRTTLAAEKALEDGVVSLRGLMGVDGSMDVAAGSCEAHGYAPIEGGFPRRLRGKLTVGKASEVLPAALFPKQSGFSGDIQRASWSLLPGATEEQRAAKATPVE